MCIKAKLGEQEYIVRHRYYSEDQDFGITLSNRAGLMKNAEFKIDVLKDVCFTLKKGEYASIIGRSGSGKSTLLYILSTMDTDYSGDLFIDGSSVYHKTEEELAFIRNEKIGFVFQFHYLLPEFSVLENVMIPAKKLGAYPLEQIRENAMKKIQKLGESITELKVKLVVVLKKRKKLIWMLPMIW